MAGTMINHQIDILCFGELLVRLAAPNKERLLQSPRLNTCIGGAEANVAVGLARLGHRVRMASLVADNDLGKAAITQLRAHGVDTTHIQTAHGRMGLYFLTPGAGMRPTEVLYDRAQSAFALAKPDAFDWPALLCGVKYLHLSGITPALGPACAAHALEAVKAAHAAKVIVSFDGNYRANLWQASRSSPREILCSIISYVNIFFGNHRDISLLLDRDFASIDTERHRQVALAALSAFPHLELIASTTRQIENTDLHKICARIDTRKAQWATEEVSISGIVDRIGTGDAFAAGVLHGLANNVGEVQALQYGLALMSLKHSLPGDFPLFSEDDIAKFLSGEREVQR
jgi:2-dehydro-3-deoxygluconokinase